MEAYSFSKDPAEKTKFADTPIFNVINVLKDKYHIYHRDASKEIFNRYSSHILFHARRRAGTVYRDDPEEVAQDVTLITIKKIILGIQKFNANQNIDDPHDQFKAFFKWVMRILKNEFINVTREQAKALEVISDVQYLDKDEREPSPLDEDEEVDEQEFESRIPVDSRIRIDKAIRDVLNDDERRVLSAFLDFGVMNGKFWTLPREHKDKLREALKCESNTIDVIKLRTVKKLRNALLN